MTKESQRSRLAGFRGRVEQTGHPKTGMALLRQNPGPFLRLERDAVGAMKARGNETDPFRRPGAEGDGTHAASTLAARAAMQTEKFPGLGVGLHPRRKRRVGIRVNPRPAVCRAARRQTKGLRSWSRRRARTCVR